MILYLFSGLTAVWSCSISLLTEVEVSSLNTLNIARLLGKE